MSDLVLIVLVVAYSLRIGKGKPHICTSLNKPTEMKLFAFLECITCLSIFQG